MKDKKKHIDQYFEDKLKGLQPAASEADWQAILSKMEPAPPSRKKGFWWIPLLLLPIALVVVWLLYPFDHPVKNGSKNSTQLTIDQSHKPELNSTSGEIQPTPKKMEDVSKNSSPEYSTTEVGLAHPEIKQGSKKRATGVQAVNHSFNKSKNVVSEDPIENESDPRSPGLQLWNMDGRSISAMFDYSELQFSMPELMPFPFMPPSKKLIPEILPSPKNPPLLNLSPYFAVNRYQARFNAEDPLYNKYRNASDHPVWLSDMGLKIEHQKGKMIMNSGIIYSQKGQQFKGQTRYMLYDSFPHLNPQGQIIGYFRVNYRDTTVEIKNVTKTSFVEIPINIGRSFQIKKSTLTASVGTTISILTGSDGLAIADNLGLHQASDMSLFNYRKWMQSAQVELSYKYAWNQRFSGGVGIQQRAGLTNLYKNEPFSQKFMNTGGFITLNFRF